MKITGRRRNLNDIIAEAEGVQVDFDGVVEMCKRTLMFAQRQPVSRYMTPQHQARMAALCQHHLDTLTSERIELMKTLHRLEGLLAEAERILHGKYEERLAKMRVSDQKQFIEGKTFPIVRKIRTVKTLLNIVDLFMENLKQTHWTITRLQSALEATMRLERGT